MGLLGLVADWSRNVRLAVRCSADGVVICASTILPALSMRCTTMLVISARHPRRRGMDLKQRDNRRLLDAILTAISIWNDEELLNDEALLEQRRADGELSEESYQAI